MLHNPWSELQAPGEQGYILGWARSRDVGLALLIRFPQGRTCPLYAEEKNWGLRGLAEFTVAARQFQGPEASHRPCGVHQGASGLCGPRGSAPTPVLQPACSLSRVQGEESTFLSQALWPELKEPSIGELKALPCQGLSIE